MNSKTVAGALLASALILASAAAFAQHGPPGKPKTPPRAQEERGQADRDRAFDRELDRDRMRDQAGDSRPDFSRLDDDDIYGRELLSAEERNEYRRQMQNASSAEERRRIEEQHREMVLSRAKERGVNVQPPGRGIYGGALMTVEERNEYRERLRSMDSEADRQRFIAEHREEMRSRAREQGRPLEDLEETIKPE